MNKPITPEQMEKRAPAYMAIDSERNFQDEKWGVDKKHAVGSWILLIEEAVLKARQAWYNAKGDETAMDRVRVVGSLAVACMEEHGAPMRGGKLVTSEDVLLHDISKALKEGRISINTARRALGLEPVTELQ